MKVIITALLMAFLIASVVAEFEQWFKDNHYDDQDAFYVAQETSDNNEPLKGYLYPKRDFYEKIHKELKSIRHTRPELKDIHHKPLQAPGKVYLTNYDLDALHKSKYGPIEVTHATTTSDTYLVSFSRPYYFNDNFYQSLKSYRKNGVSGARPVLVLPQITSIHRLWSALPINESHIQYVFTKYDECVDEIKCDHKKDRQWFVTSEP